jgi:polyketide synthase PksM
VGVIVLKPYHQAIKDGDTIYALIRGTAVNHGGKSNDYTTPNPNQQAAVIQQALEQNNLDPRTISYIEAAANGSEMGDAIEMTALTKVFGNRSGVKGDYKIGSVKPNIGHCESASGMAQLIKVILALNHKTLAPTLLTGELNPNIYFDRLPFQLQQEGCEWKPVTVDGAEAPRRAGITNVGASGVNAHMIVEEYIPPTITSNSPPLPLINKSAPPKPLLFILSAKNKERLEDYVKQWLGYLQKNPAIELESTAYTLQMGREEMPCRLAIVMNSQEELLHQLQQWHEHRENADCCYFGDVKHNKLVIPEGVAPVIETGDLHQLAKLWVLGNSIPWQDLYRGKKLSRVTGLPTYPFKRRRCWPGPDQTDYAKKTYQSKMPWGDRDEGNTNKAVELYTLGAQGKSTGFEEEYLTFCPFEEKVPGFSMSGVFLHPEKYPVHYELMKAKQIEMRQVLFCKEDFNQIHTLLDIGCGYGTDVIQIAALYPHIQTHGFTITRAQAELGNQRIEQMNLSSQAKIFHKDSSKDAFPGRYDLVIGIEVSFHIRNKQGLFQNITSALKEDGKVLLMDYIANLRGPITDPDVEISIPTRQDWIDILSKHHLAIDEIIDVSPQVANFLYDPDIQQNTKDLPKVARDTFQNYANQSVSLENGWISYCLFKLKKDSNCSQQERRDENVYKISDPTPYPQALAEMLSSGHIPYPKTSKSLANSGKPDADPVEKGHEQYTREQGGLPPCGFSDRLPDPGTIKADLQDIFITVLKLQREELEETSTFKELGINSLNAVQLLEAINTRFNLTLPTSVVFEYNHLDSLAGYIGEHLQESRTKQDPPGDQITHPAKESPVEKHDMVQTGSFTQEPVQPLVSKQYHGKASDAIAIIGLSCRCAGANDQDEFRDIIHQGKDCIREIKNKSWLDFFKFNSSKKVPTRYGAMDEIEYFDPLFFQISPKEAESMDASQRILLEECYKALEDSCYPPASLREQPVGTVIGTMGSTPTGQDFSHLSMLGSDTSILAARIAYCLDLKGPALAINTACSSSLAAIDIACQKLKSRDINMAIAGGISIYTQPGAFIAMNNAGMLSLDGVCRPFDQEADGIVVGDGVGVVILKRLADARQDNDYIYGIIRGSGTNQDGQTSGITVPSFLAQSQLEESIYRKNQICVEDIQYIETHGTGTKLGDPVEIHALTEAFKKFTTRKRFCGIGSLKANIGHTTAAAGVLSLIKVLLSLKHKQIPPLIHFNKENEHIDFANSPFFVNSSLKEWPVNSQGSRLAAVSSFGFSGTNAHLVIEEYHGNSQGNARDHESTPGLLVLSAESHEGLHRYAKKTGEFLHAHKDINLPDFMYTFQVGREGMSYRLALAVRTKEELIEQLEQFAAGNPSKPGNIFVGKVNKKEDINIGDTTEGKEFIRELARQKKVKKLGELWVKGSGIDWEALYRAGTVKRLPGLPTYPFAREYYQVPGLDIAVGTTVPDHALSTPHLHPLLHRNTSDLSRQRFSSTFTGREFFLADHVLEGQRILPAVVYLEMAQVAVKRAAGATARKQTGIRLKNVVWAQPMVVKEKPAPVHIEIFPGDNEEITYKIYSKAETVDPGSEVMVHSQGSAVLDPPPARPALELQALKNQCTRGTLSSSQCYDAFRVMGIEYGPGHRGIEEIYVGTNQVLAKLTLPSSLSPTGDRFVLHPSLMDSALQASIGLMMGPGDTIPSGSSVPLKLALPFAVEELEIHSNCTPAMWALIRYSSGSKPGNKVQKLDIHLCDQQGKICVRMKGFSTRMTDGETGSTETAGPLMLYPYWEEQTIPLEPEAPGTDFAQHIVILCEPEEKWKLASEEAEKREMGRPAHPVKIIHLFCQQEEIEQRFQYYAIRVFEEIRNLLKNQPKGSVLVQLVVAGRDERQLFSGLSGMLKTARLENPKLLGQLIHVEPGDNWEGILEKLEENSRVPLDNHIQYQGGKRRVVRWREVEAAQNQVSIPWKDRGVYLITGGAGGLGLIFAEEITRQVKEAVLILIGRSPLEKARQSGLKELEAISSGSGTRIRYIPVDVTRKEEIASLIQGIREEFGGLQGIIHSAGVNRDNFILKKTVEELEQVLVPKVHGLVNLDQASRDLALDFFILFSSAAGVGGNIGQAGYSSANAFMDAYAGYRNTLAASKQRQGKTLSINWSLWKQGGMHVDEETQKMMRQRMGIVPMQTLTGIQAFYQSLASGRDQVMVMEGDRERLRASLLDRQTSTGPSTKPTAPGESKNLPTSQPGELQEKTAHYLKKLLATVINLPVHRIEADTPLEKYGIDSIMVMQMTDRLEKTFGSLSKTLFFEYQNLWELSGYFLESHRDRLTELLGPGAGVEAAPGNTKDSPAVTGPIKSTMDSGTPPRFSFHRPETRQEVAAGALDIAVIGISGRYPQARNTREFWKNLRDGKDCITEIPKDRWNHSLYFDEDKNKIGKTYSKWGGFLDGVDEFDPLFFNISPREVEFMDPQERLFLECVFETLEDAGYTREVLGMHPVFGAAGNVGVYVGVMYEEYQLYGAQQQVLGKPFALSGNPSSIANRVSYFCNFHGPSMAVDTMCSSSLTTIHLACESLQRGRCQVAIAGGVNLSIHPNKYLLLGQGRFVSSKGRCETFGQGGDGYVPGEGVGAVLLKPLSKAIAHRDHIYGIIKATAINHGGKTNGYSVPNPNAQTSVIGQAFREAEIDPRTISYIEAHGTGTILGDPIEIAGLTKTFREYTPDKQFCAIGSVKSNIGHSESAAGIAGVTKVLLQFQHGQLAPSLHSEVLNPNIDFSNTPFVVQQELTEWKRPRVKINGETREYPRNAGISSFGAGGSNAHVVIQEYIPGVSGSVDQSVSESADREQAPLEPHVIILSAKNEDRLNAYVGEIANYLEKINTGDEKSLSKISLGDIAYTLQVGREAMEERLALIVGSINELKEKLEGFLEGRDGIEDLYRGQVKRNKEALAVFAADEELQEAVEKWIQRKKYTKLLDLWVKGLVFDWNKLYRDDKLSSHQPRRISLPTYPFSRDRYWVPEIDPGLFSPTTGSPAANPGAYLHPLLHQNTSDFSEQRFTSTFTGQEFFLADHVVKGQRILPGAAYLEMARAAVEQALGTREKSQTMIQLKNVVWLQPIVVGDQPARVHIGLFPGNEGQVDYKVYSGLDGTGTGPVVVHSQGTARLNTTAEIPMLDIKALQDECSRATLSSGQLYEAFRAGGIEYGPGHRGVEKIYTGTGQVLAKLSLPSHLAKTREQFVLHPGLLDAAFQASVGLMLNPGDTIPANGTASLKPALAFALQELEILGRCTPSMWALVRYSDGSNAGDKVQKLDIHLCDDRGTICVSMKEITSRVLEGKIQPDMSTAVSPGTANEPLVDTDTTGKPLMVIPRWDSIPAAKGPTFPSPEDPVVIAGGSKDSRNALEQLYPRAHRLEIQAEDTSDEIAKKLEAYGSPRPIAHILWVAPHPGPDLSKEKAAFTVNDILIDQQNRGVLYCFRMIKALLGLGYATRELGWTVITIQAQPIGENHWIDPTHASLHGLFGSLAKEYSNWKIRVIDLEADSDWPMADMFTLPADPQGNAWGYRGRQWYRQQLVPFDSPPPVQRMYRPGGVYVVIGGAGGIGAAWSEYMIRFYQAQITWIGRREKDADIQNKIDSLAVHGPAPIYITANAADQKELEQAYREIKQRGSQVHGVVHSAVGMLGRSLANLDEEQFKNGLTAKIQVSVRMAQVFQKEPLDFIMFFSSTNSFLKTRGQSSYAAGCTFKDAFAYQLSRERTCTVKIMNWGYWGSVGAIAESGLFRDWMKQEGIGSIEPGEAMEALETLLAGPMKQMALVKATKPSGLEGLNLVEETIKIYPEHFTSTGKNLQNALQLPKQNSLLQDLEPVMELEKKEMDKLLARLMWGQLQSIGLFTEEKGVIDHLKTKTGLPDLYRRWFEETTAILTDRDYLQRDGNSYRVKDPAPMDMDAAWQEWDRQKGPWLDDPNREAQVTLIEAALRALPEILTGKRSAIDVLFPNSSMELVEGIYKNNPVADYFNEVLADTVITFIQERLQQDPSASIRILEIGAGTGGTSAMVFSKLRSLRDRVQEYCYTDISRAFLMHAEKEYGPQNPYLTYHTFDVSAPVAGQGIKAGVYDIAIAANVLHAAKNIRQALRNSKAALKKNGLLVLNELSGNSLFLHLTFGLLEGWWLYEDPGLRIRGCPGLTPGTWQQVLESEGFRGVLFPTQEAHDLGQQVIAAESDGVVRQKQHLKPVKQKPLPVDASKKINSKAVNHEVEPHPETMKIATGSSSLNHSPDSPHSPISDVTHQMLEDYVKETIIEKLSEALKVETHIIDVNESFADYGLDSILAVNLIQVINQALGIELKITTLFDYSSINQLTTYILSQYQDTITPTSAQKEKPPGTHHGLTPGKKEESPLHVDSYPNRFLRKSEWPETGIKKKEAVIQTGDSNPKDLIAIIGMSGQFAKSGTVNRLWEHLAKGSELIEEVSRWDLSKYSWEFSQAKKNYCKQGSFLEDITLFDPVFFNISGVEATYMDPQQRFFLEESWKALEDAGYAGTAVQGRRCGVYAGCQAGDYLGVIGDNPPAQAMWGNLNSVLASRIAYFLNLQGPAVAIDTACSSSLVAIHLACQGLRDGETEMALAGGVFIQSTPGFYISGNKSGMLSPSGHCYTFDQRADGFVPGEGVGAVVLKRLKEAIADGDHIYGVIRGSGINQDGTTNGITAPSANSQERLERRVYDAFNINPEDIQVVEAHGTATKLGDPIEFEALNRAFGKYTDKKEYCAIGSIKTNIGHTTAASGIAGLIKVLLSLQHKQIPPSLNFQSANENIRFKDSPFYVNTTLKDWDIEPDSKRRAVISSFGLSGTNAHMVIEEAPGETPPPGEKPGYLLVLSARTLEQLRQQVQQLVEYCEQQSPAGRDCRDISYTLLLGRKHFRHRLACVVRSREELTRLLKKWLEKGKVQQIYVSKVDEKNHREQPSLKRYGNQCLRDCQDTGKTGEYLENLATIAELYIQGYELEYGQLFSKERCSRISLPTYPFDRGHYWVSGTNARFTGGAGSSGVSIPGSRVEDHWVQRNMYILKKQWELCPATPTRNLKRTVAILATPETRGLAVLLSRHFPGSQILLPRDFENQDQQPGEPQYQWNNYDGCVDLTGCGTGKNESLNWLAWLGQLVEHGHRQGLMMLCVTRGLESYRENSVNLSAASRVGLYRMLQSEYSHLRSRHMDVETRGEDDAIARLAASEFLIDSRDPEVCYRDGKRWRAYLREMPTSDDKTPPLDFPADHVLWITGGTRGLGYLCARHFITRYGIKYLVLTGREALPPREQWDSYQRQNTPTAKKIRDIRTLETMGVQVRVLSVPLTDEPALQQALLEIKQSMGPIGGIIHCAGSIDSENPAFIRKSIPGIQQVLDPKVTGLDIMIRNFKSEPLRFFILFSSVSAIVPGLAVGQSDYAMANAYMDYTAEANIHDCPIISIQWPNWKETGMGQIKTRVYEQTGLLGLTDAEGLQLLDQIIAGKPGPVVLPLVVNPGLWKPRHLMQHTIQKNLSIPGRSPRPQQHTAVDEPQVPDDLLQATQQWLISLFSRELKIDASKLDIDTPVQDYGVDSILLAQLLQQINQLVSGELDPSIFYEHTTIESFAAWLAGNYASSLSTALGTRLPGQADPQPQDSLSSPRLSPISPGDQPSIQELQTEPRLHHADNRADVAVIGLSCRFPGAGNPEEYWELLSQGRSAIGPVPGKRWGRDNHFYAGLIDNITHFDPKFFLIPGDDFKAMDPQALVVLEESLNLFYHAGYSHREIRGKPVGVFLGGRSQHQPDEASLRQARNLVAVVGQNYLAANISQFFDLKGPALVIDTACSSALVGMNMAIQALHSGEIESALVGGVSLLTTDAAHRMFQQRGILSREPYFHIFDRRASGVMLGEGAGMVLLKTVPQALQDGDQIYAVIKALTINNDGRTAGPATPNLQTQKEVMQRALAKSGKKPGDISYIEANGSGSQVTDLLELKAIQSIYRSSTRVPCGLGSMKPNIGHPLCAEGIASFIKVVLMLQHGQWVPFLSGQQPMKHFDLESSPFYFCRKLTEWTTTPRIAAINCFADGGTNAHVILQAWEDPDSRPVKRHPLPPPQLNPIDVRYAGSATSPLSPANQSIGDDNVPSHGPGQGPLLSKHRQTSTDGTSTWKQNQTSTPNKIMSAWKDKIEEL